MAHASKRSDHGMDWEAVDSRHRRVMPRSRPASQRWALTVCGAVLFGLIALMGWGGYSLAVVKAELRQLKARIEARAPVGPGEPPSAQPSPQPGEPTAPPHLPRAGVDQGTSRGGVAQDPRDGPAGDRPQPQSAPPSPADAGGDTAPRVFVHIRSAAQRQAAQSLTQQLTAQGYVFPKAAILVERGPRQTQVRYFRRADAGGAAQLAALLTQAHGQPAVTRFIGGYADSLRRQPRHYEVWLAPDPG
jgi:hypothetical protein